MCPRKQMKRKLGAMDQKLFEKIILQTKEYSNFIWLHHMGEPLLDVNIDKKINFCKKHNIRVGISTNGTLLDEKNSRKLLNTDLDQILISIDGAVKETYEKIRRNGDFEKTVSNIETFLRLKKKLKKKKPSITLQIILMKETEEEINQFIKKWKPFNVEDILVKRFSTWSGYIPESETLAKPEHKYKKKAVKQRPPCYYLWHSVVILQDGGVVLCCKDFDGLVKVGDLKKQTLDEIWNSEKMTKLREQQIKGNFNNPLCKNCQEWPDLYPCACLLNVKNSKFFLKKINDRIKNR
jgi:radical SAM protein with 4Fe4S-binding SPASM domain